MQVVTKGYFFVLIYRYIRSVTLLFLIATLCLPPQRRSYRGFLIFKTHPRKNPCFPLAYKCILTLQPPGQILALPRTLCTKHILLQLFVYICLSPSLGLRVLVRVFYKHYLVHNLSKNSMNGCFYFTDD